MIRHGLILALLVTLGVHPQYVPSAHFPTGAPPLNPCLISGWPMNEGSGPTLNDVSGNTNTGSVSVPNWGTNAGFPGSSLTVPPSGNATSTTLTNFTGAAAFSLAAWINITPSQLNEIILSDRNGSGTGWELTSRTLGNTSAEFIIVGSGGDSLQVHGSTTIVATGKHYIVVTYDGSKLASGVKIYVDGVADTVTTITSPLTTSAASGRAAGIGNRPGDGNQMAGVLNAAAIYNCVLNSTDIATYNGRGPQVN